jgi:hypothetical protein
MILLGSGNRNWTDYVAILTALGECRKNHLVTKIIHGNARGADTYIEAASQILKIPTKPYPADWEQYGRAAGPIRNAQMLFEGRPDMMVAFASDFQTWSGTVHMCVLASNANLPMACLRNIDEVKRWAGLGCPFRPYSTWLTEGWWDKRGAC